MIKRTMILAAWGESFRDIVRTEAYDLPQAEVMR